MQRRAIVQVTLWNSPYLGNFMASEVALAGAVRERFDLGTHFVLADGAAGQPWLADLERAGVSWSVLGDKRGEWRGQIDAIVREQRAALIHAHFTAADLQSAASASSAGVPCVWHIRTGFNGYPLTQRAKDVVKLRIVARRQVARIVAVSEWLADLAIRRGAPRDLVQVIPNAIVADRFAHLPTRGQARERFGLDPDAEVVLCLGWWPEVKGVDVFLDAMTLVAARRPKLQALLVGEQQMREFLAGYVPEQPPWLRLSGFVDDPGWLFAASDVFVSSSRHEGQSGAIGEALTCGRPVVMSDILGNSTWSEAPNVRTFASEHADELAEQVTEVLEESPQARRAAGEASRRWCESSLGMDAWCEQVCGLYDALLA